MKLLITGDWHIRATAPRHRIDSYYNKQMGKLLWIMNLAKKKGCSTILQPGDFFDSPDVPNHVKRDIIKLILLYNIPIYTVFGQHDTKYRNKGNTALAVLAEANIVTLLGEQPVVHKYEETLHIYGASWQESIPNIVDSSATNILVLHKMIVQDKPLFPDQREYNRAPQFLKQYNSFDLIVSGDNHNSFKYTADSTLINCGSLMRMTTAQYTHKPCVWIYDTNTKQALKYLIPIEDAAEVFAVEAEEIKERNKELEAFVKTLSSGSTKVTLSFEDNLEALLHTTNIEINTEIVDLCHSILAKYYEGGKQDA